MSNTRIAYRTASGAPSGVERAAEREKRIQFVTARNAALMSQRGQAAQRLAVLRGDIARIQRAITSEAELSDAQKVLHVLEQTRTAEQKLVAEIVRLNSKIR